MGLGSWILALLLSWIWGIVIFETNDTRPAGHVFTLPTGRLHFGDRKPTRPFLLLTRCGGDDLGNLALMTSKRTEQLYGATLVELADQRGKLNLPDQESSFVNLSSLSFFPAGELRRSESSCARHLPVVRAALSEALGIGTGVGDGREGGSLRGFVVRLADDIAADFEFRYGIVVTGHRYSAVRRLQIVVPLVDAADFLSPGESRDDFRPLPGDVLPTASPTWTQQLPARWLAPVIDTARLVSFSHRWTASPRPETWLDPQIDLVYPVPVDIETLGAVERALTSLLDLPARPG